MSKDRKALHPGTARSAVPPQIIDEATEWFVAMRELDTSTEEREAFAEWLRASPVHVGAYLEIARLWTDASHIDRGFTLDLNEGLPPNVIPLPAERTVRDKRDSSRATRPRRLAIAWVASLLLALIAGGMWLYANRPPTYVTGIGEQRTITLDDGSIVRLNSRSRVEVRMSPRQRQIELVDGQALFEVAHDPSRPFTVQSGPSTIRAIGTQFDVNRRQSGTTVTVIEGRVRLGATPLSAGEQLRVATSGALEKITKPNTAAAISWLQQELIFEGQPLSDVVEEFNRYTRTPIVLNDRSLGELRINAVFHSTSPDSLLRFISRYDTVQVQRTGKEIRIVKRQ
jgi:transmembrane sensor